MRPRQSAPPTLISPAVAGPSPEIPAPLPLPGTTDVRERGRRPARREEDVARPLNFAEHLQARPNESTPVILMQRVIQETQCLEHPRLVPPIRQFAEPFEGAFPLRRIRRERGQHELKPRL